MGGLLVLALIGAYVWWARKLVKRANTLWSKTFIVIAAVLIPTADAVYGRFKLKQMCEAEGGLHIYRVAEDVEGFDDPSARPYEEWITQYGYQVVEGTEIGGKPSRLSLQPDGKIVRETGIVPITEYVYEIEKGNAGNIFNRDESRIRVRNTGEVLGRDINISYAGGWFERFVNGLYAARGTAGACGSVVSKHELVTKTLKPIKREEIK